MGFGKKKRQVREAIATWSCFGRFGYGEGRAVAQFGEDGMHGKSACADICNRANACRLSHRDEMNSRYPQLSQLVEATARIASIRGLDVSTEVIMAMRHAADMMLDEAVEVKRILGLFKVDDITDHYRCGHFENIHNGLHKASPTSRIMPKSTKKSLQLTQSLNGDGDVTIKF